MENKKKKALEILLEYRNNTIQNLSKESIEKGKSIVFQKKYEGPSINPKVIAHIYECGVQDTLRILRENEGIVDRFDIEKFMHDNRL